ncbi:MAG: hypothetical protein HOV80_30210 [Polyangiaceae bacterium]|nr:hypothetical protein [Polyangiaceae bacterium]
MKPHDPAGRAGGTTRFRFGHGFRPVVMGILGLIAGIFLLQLSEGPATLFGAFKFAVLVAALFYGLRALGSVEVGDDGIVVRRILQRVVVPIESVRDVETWWEQRMSRGGVSTSLKGLVITRDGGSAVYLPLGDDSDRLLAIKEEILSRVRAAKIRKTPALAALARGTRPVPAWVDELRSLLRRTATFRDQALAPEDAGDVLADPTATTEQRIGAAVALRALGDDSTKEGIRIAASGTAEPRLRIALEKIAEDDDAAAEIEAALADEAQKRARS